MVSNGNGKTLKLIGIIISIIVLVGGIIGFGINHVVANDQASRARDTGLDNRVDVLELRLANDINEIKLSQRDTKKDIQYLVEAIKNGR